ncbi:hypothetical protein SAMN05421493_102110 [Pseudobutyrivibrio sp. 49]|uniref:hypothetical protein n=1 Tax=Pseudobutyrivibrio sp. 49 TaxID=1855344 RepID=UPI000881407A|nr:hypothetical protein [Pseudobutyrivibrio sp. 49]SDH60868.1 hypothetical protein SAMN05421493_102110 [Pseudobutyrivibrio sp. 49]
MKNIYLSDLLFKIYKIRSLDFYFGVNQLCKIDSIANGDELIEEIKKLDKTKPLFVPGELCLEGINYGHINELYRFAGLRKRSNVYVPLVEHGVRFGEEIGDFECSDYNFCHITQGEYRKKMIHEFNPNIPVYSIGPYIHYAKSFYDAETIADMREKNGKTVVVFHSHSEEVKPRECKLLVDEMIKQFEGRYKTIILCGYWFNLDNAFIDDCLKKNVKIVSAGVRWDTKFIRRLKTIIELADAIAVDEVGTQIGYAMCLGKKIEILNSADIEAIEPDNIYNKNRKRILQAIKDNDSTGLTKEYEKYWGGNKIKSQEELRAILDNCRDVLKLAKYNPDNYAAGIDKQISYLENHKTENNDLKLRLLKEALND